MIIDGFLRECIDKGYSGQSKDTVAYGTGTTPPIPVYSYPIIYIADEWIEKFACAVVKKIRGEEDES